MTEIGKLIALRDNLVARRRSLATSLQRAAPEQLSGESISRIRIAIDALNRAIEEEMRGESVHEGRRRAVPA